MGANARQPHASQLQENPGVEVPQATQAPSKQRNALGIIGFVCALLGVLFSCIPGWLILGWILLPISFILGLVGLFLKGPKKLAISAIIISVIGTVIAAMVLVFVVGKAFDETFDKDTAVSDPVQDSNEASLGADDAGVTRSNPLPIGTTVESGDWAITLNGVDLNADGVVMAENPFNEPAGEGRTYILANLTVAYKGSNPQGETPTAIVEYVSVDGQTFHSFDAPVVVPDELDTLTTLYEGGSETGNVAFSVPAESAGAGVFAISPEVFSEKKFFSAQ